MDWSDENYIKDRSDSWCFAKMTTIDCDEHLCHNQLWSCGDGQCINWHDRLIFQNIHPQSPGCRNLRNMNYMCELTSIWEGWTLPNGLCGFFQESLR